ncbi:MAG: ferritin [Bacilli bacterium]|jgi:ferritin|nr:ferritin [Bacilli bacterium]
MLNKNVSKLLNEQVNKEMFSAYLYLDMAHYYINKGMEGFANWFKVQAKEEMDHAMLFIQYLQNNGFEVELEAIAKPSKTYGNHRVPLEEALKHEEFVTASINAIYEEAMKTHEFKTQEFLHWFIKEQVEEEKNATDLILAYDLHNPNGLFALDGKLRTREYKAPSLELD